MSLFSCIKQILGIVHSMWKIRKLEERLEHTRVKIPGEANLGKLAKSSKKTKCEAKNCLEG